MLFRSGTAVGAAAAVALPSWGLPAVAITVAAVLAGEALALRDPELEDG